MAFAQWTAGMRITASRLAGMTPKWQAWTPTWTTSTGVNTPSYGDATLNCRWCQSGDLVIAHFAFWAGATTNYGGGGGSDNYRWSLPVAAKNPVVPIGWLSCFVGTGSATPLVAMTGTTGDFELWVAGGGAGSTALSGGVVDAMTPFTWGANSVMWGTLQYEAG